MIHSSIPDQSSGEHPTSNKGYVYVLSNPLMPDVVHIGHTGLLGAHHAVSQLGSYWRFLPAAFVVEFELLCQDRIRLFTAVQLDLLPSRVERSPYFYRTTVAGAAVAIFAAAFAEEPTRGSPS